MPAFRSEGKEIPHSSSFSFLSASSNCALAPAVTPLGTQLSAPMLPTHSQGSCLLSPFLETEDASPSIVFSEVHRAWFSVYNAAQKEPDMFSQLLKHAVIYSRRQPELHVLASPSLPILLGDFRAVCLPKSAQLHLCGLKLLAPG